MSVELLFQHLMDVCGIVQDGSNIPPLPLGENRSKKSTAILISAHIFDKLAPLLVIINLSNDVIRC